MNEREARKLWRLVCEFAGAAAANAIVQMDAENDDSASQSAMARREQKKEETRRERVRDYIAALAGDPKLNIH